MSLPRRFDIAQFRWPPPLVGVSGEHVLMHRSNAVDAASYAGLPSAELGRLHPQRGPQRGKFSILLRITKNLKSLLRFYSDLIRILKGN